MGSAARWHPSAHFDARPTIVRLYGRARVVLAGEDDFAELRAEFPKAETAGQRSVVLVDLDRVSDACGYAVPLMQHVGERDTLDRSHGRRDDDCFTGCWRQKNARSIDGLSAIPVDPSAPDPSSTSLP